MGTDACLLLTGGERPHLGAVAVAQVRPSLTDTDKLGATVSNITLLGHKEDALACSLAEKFAIGAVCNTVVCCGVHLDNITPSEIKTIVLLSNEMVDEVLQYKYASNIGNTGN